MSRPPLTPGPNADDDPPEEATHREFDPASSGPAQPDVSSELSADTLIHREKPAPRGGWRRAVFTATRGHINPGDSKLELRRTELEKEVRGAATPAGHQRIVVLGARKGVGTTTTALGLGSVLAQRGDRALAVAVGTRQALLSDLLPLRTPAERDLDGLLAAPGSADRYSDLSPYVAQSQAGLDVLASLAITTPGSMLSPVDLRRISAVVERFYSLQILDGGSALEQPILPVLLERATRLIVVAHPSREGGNRAATALDEVTNIGHPHLASTALIALPRAKDNADIDDLEEQLSRRCHRALRVAEDIHLAHHSTVDPGKLRAPAMIGYLRLASEVLAASGRNGPGASDRG